MTCPADDAFGYLEEHAAYANRITTMIDNSDRMPGPHRQADEDGGVTVGEYHRLSGVLDNALDVHDWLTERPPT